MSSPVGTDTSLPVHILTGFLGSGKTTLLNRLLATDTLNNSAVIVNEYGDIGIDHHLIEASDDRFVELAGGCVCCAVRGDLALTLAALLEARLTGRCPMFAQVLIETTGLADPNPIINLLAVDPYLAEHVRLGATLVTVDAVNGLDTLATFAEATQQVLLADTVLLTKTDLRPASAQLSERVRAINPNARFVSVTTEQALPAADTLLDDRGTPGPPHSHHHQHTDDIESFVVRRSQPLHPAVVPLFVEALAQQLGVNLLRLKGIVQIAGRETGSTYHGVLHAAQHVFHPLAAFTDETYQGDTELVFIVRGQAHAFVESLLDAVALEVSDTLTYHPLATDAVRTTTDV